MDAVKPIFHYLLGLTIEIYEETYQESLWKE